MKSNKDLSNDINHDIHDIPGIINHEFNCKRTSVISRPPANPQFSYQQEYYNTIRKQPHIHTNLKGTDNVINVNVCNRSRQQPIPATNSALLIFYNYNLERI